MRRVALIYNPASGQHMNGYSSAIEEALAVLRAAGVEADVRPTSSPGTGGQLAQQAVLDGCDTILACGGDGTVNEVLQSMVGSAAALGVVPMGTANALATDLGLSAPPAKAVTALLNATPVRIPVGRIFFTSSDGAEHSRYFTVAAGIGADGEFFYRLNTQLKRRFGYAVYLLAAMQVWAAHSFPFFSAAFVAPITAVRRREDVSQLLAVRIGNFGGLVNNLVPGAALSNPTLRVLAFKTRSRLRYFRFVAAVLFRRHTYSGDIESIEAAQVECSSRDHSASRIYVEADGELLGFLPVRMEIVPDALTLLIPAHSQK
jgi:diacylglycerol kinase (ATP)